MVFARFQGNGRPAGGRQGAPSAGERGSERGFLLKRSAFTAARKRPKFRKLELLTSVNCPGASSETPLQSQSKAWDPGQPANYPQTLSCRNLPSKHPPPACPPERVATVADFASRRSCACEQFCGLLWVRFVCGTVAEAAAKRSGVQVKVACPSI